MQLILAEKPSVAKDIVAALTPVVGAFAARSGYWESATVLVSHAVGHLVEIDSERIAPAGAPLPIIPHFALRPIERTQGQFRLVAQILNHPDVTNIVNACDAGREGELIFRLILEAAGIGPRSGKRLDRMWLQSMTQQAIQDSYAVMRSDEEMQPLAAAAYCRMEADWLVGINGSRVISQTLNRSMSAGRVQTPALALIVRRDREIRDFKPVDYFEVHGTFALQAGTYVGKFQNANAVKGEPAERIPDLATAQAVVAHCSGHNPSSVTEETKPTKQGAPKLFDLTTLQREANKRHGLSANDTLALVQSLYEKHKALTYPRTSANTLPDDYAPTVNTILQSLALSPVFTAAADRVLASNWVNPADKRVFDSGKVTDHFAIIPTGVLPAELTPAEAAIYELVTRRFIAAFYPPAKFLDTVRITVVNNAHFKSTGRVLVTEGWQSVYSADTEDEETDAEKKQPALAPYVAGEMVQTQAVRLQALETKPPKPYTEASLLSAMEHAGRLVEDELLAEAMKEHGLGTPATRAAIIERLLSAPKGQLPYVQRDKKNLIATQRGIDLVAMLDASGIEFLTSPTMTGDWEYKLLRMEKGQVGRREFMQEIAQLIRTMVATIAESRPVAEPLKAPCPKCSGPLVPNGRTIDCQCGWKFWMSMANRPFSVQEVETLLSARTIGPLSGFVGGKPGSKPFTATVVLDGEGKPTFSFTLPCNCPKCGAASLEDGPAAVNCSGCGWMLWKKVASKPLTDKQVLTLITTRRLPKMEGFISSRTGKPFGAALRLADEDFTVKFVFD